MLLEVGPEEGGAPVNLSEIPRTRLIAFAVVVGAALVTLGWKLITSQQFVDLVKAAIGILAPGQ